MDHGQGGRRRCAQAGGHRLLQRPLFHLCGRLRGLYRRGLQHAPAGEKYLRPPGYVLEGATRLGSIQAYPLTVEHDGGVEEGGFCYGMVSNTVSVGGFKACPPSRPPRRRAL